MDDLTWFGVFYIVLTAIGALYKVNQIGVPREPINTTEAILGIVAAVLLTWGLLTWGVTTNG